MKKLLINIFLFVFVISCSTSRRYNQTEHKNLPKRNKLILQGAKKELENETDYNTDMLDEYVATMYFKGKKKDHKVYPYGDVNPKEGVCTDLIIRACRNAKIDLQKLVHEDVKVNKKYYGVKQADKYIDHRRVWILLKYFKRHYKKLTTKTGNGYKDWKAGDIVVWDVGSKKHLHIGIISDRIKKSSKKPYVIHNMRWIPFVFPGDTCEQDYLFGAYLFGIRVKTWKIIGHFRL